MRGSFGAQFVDEPVQVVLQVKGGTPVVVAGLVDVVPNFTPATRRKDCAVGVSKIWKMISRPSGPIPSPTLTITSARRKESRRTSRCICAGAKPSSSIKKRKADSASAQKSGAWAQSSQDVSDMTSARSDGSRELR